MRITQLQRPLVAAASSLTRRPTPATGTTTIRQLQEALGALRIGASNATVEGRRYASVKSQGMYKLRDSSTIPKKLGAKKSGDSYVITGNIIYKQRGTKWFPGENVGMGRDHTIFALASGYVKYYRDPARHPKRQYIGVVFDKADTLPYPAHAARKRRLNMTASAIPAPAPQPELSPSGIPTQVVRLGLERSRRPHPRDVRVLKLDRDGSSYAYSEENWRLGTLVRTEKRKMGSRRVAMKHRRRKVKAISKEMRAEREDKIARRKEALDAQRAAKMRKMREYRERKKAEAAAAGQGQGGAAAPLPPPPKTSPPAAEV